MHTLKLQKKITDEETDALIGKYLDDSSYDFLVDYDADGYDSETGALLFKFRKAVIPKQIAAAAYKSARTAATPTSNRMSASGEGTKFKVLKSGSISKTNVSGKPVNSGVVGFYDRYVRIPYCRTTAWTMKHFDRFKKLYPLIKYVDEKYFELVGDKYILQREVADKTSKDFVITDTAFTTVTVNKNYQTAVHTDKGDFKNGFGNLVVLRAGRYEGGYFVLPQYRVAINLNNLDLLFVDVHKPHGNTPIKFIDKNAERISLVMYYRENMKYCGTKEQELELAKSRKEGDELVRINMNNNGLE